MHRLCDEILQIILNELDDPTNLTLASKRFHAFTQDPYVRASYFLWRYGPIQALYWALGRGRLMTKEVIDILLSSGAQLSRYLAQCAMHHYYRTAQVPFIKTPWVRSMNLIVFTHFQLTAVRIYGDIPLGKGDDDATLFDTMIKESRFPVESRLTRTDSLREVLVKYKFIPFCNKDAMMANFPLVLSIEPSLLPLAQANGFHMDHKYRDFVFRKMFEKPAITFITRSEEIIRNVRELTSLDPLMFLTRTVAGEICMEAKTNEPAYSALKKLDQGGMLRFKVSRVIEDLIKTYANTRSITNANCYSTLRQLYIDYPSRNSLVRQVLILQIFLAVSSSPGPNFPTVVTASLERYVDTCRQKIESVGLGPVKRTDLTEVLSSKFAPEKFEGIIEYGRAILHMTTSEIEGLVQDVAFRCLEISCKGKMLKALVTSYPFLKGALRTRIMQNYKLNPEDLPPWQEEAACSMYEAPLCQDYFLPRRHHLENVTFPRQPTPSKTVNAASREDSGDNNPESKIDRRVIQVEGAPTVGVNQDDADLGTVGQDTLSSMIRKDEMAPTRGRRRFYETYANFHESQGKLNYPHDSIAVGTWVRAYFGPRSAVTAIFMLHNVINGNPMTVAAPSHQPDDYSLASRVPVTLKQFKVLARLGRSIPGCLFDDIEAGAEFYFSEDDYLTQEELAPPKRRLKLKHRPRIRIKPVKEYTVKTESSPGPSTPRTTEDQDMKPRLRRHAVSSVNYYIPGSDDEMITSDESEEQIKEELHAIVRKRKEESNLQKWIKHLSVVLKEEHKKYSEKKKALQASVGPNMRLKVPKSEFHRHLTTQLSRLRKTDKDKRQQLYGLDYPEQDYSSGEEDEYHDRNTRPTKRRKIENRT